MSEIMIMTIVKKALTVGLIIAGPILVISLLVGLIISIFQATTQIQEQTLTFVPKLIAIVLILVIIGPIMLDKLVMLTKELFSIVPNIVN